MYVYVLSEPGLWTVGFFNPYGKWFPESDHTSTESAARRVSYLNGPNIDSALPDDAIVRFRRPYTTEAVEMTAKEARELGAKI